MCDNVHTKQLNTWITCLIHYFSFRITDPRLQVRQMVSSSVAMVIRGRERVSDRVSLATQPKDRHNIVLNDVQRRHASQESTIQNKRSWMWEEKLQNVFGGVSKDAADGGSNCGERSLKDSTSYWIKHSLKFFIEWIWNESSGPCAQVLTCDKINTMTVAVEIRDGPKYFAYLTTEKQPKKLRLLYHTVHQRRDLWLRIRPSSSYATNFRRRKI
jgi:hypothetical protein